MNFDQIIDRRGTHSMKWDMMQDRYGVSPDTGISMWVADMDFRPPTCVQDALQKALDHGVYGYFGDDDAYRAAICWWMANRHGWQVDPAHIFTTHGLVNAVGLCLHTWTQPGDGVILFTPVYHAFARTIHAAGRKVVECPLALNDGIYEMDLDAADAQMTGQERMVILCSPHNPGGRVWTAQELRDIAAFCTRHDLLLVSDEIHHDLVMPGHRHIPMPVAAPDCIDRLVMLTAASKTFNLAGTHCGNVIIADDRLRGQFADTLAAMGISPNSFGLHAVTAAYSPAGAEWVDALCAYLDSNRQVFDAGVNAIPGVRSMTLQSTYLAWVDFSGTGMEPDEFSARVEQQAQIAANHGPTFGTGGTPYLRFNIGAPRSVIEQAVARLQAAFRDLQ
ncbi:MalY/PatB family protein [Roseinatronobacter alkalisoli]|uniref:cysteine-S-conjugate beta-lyase n=1 Tax=Roseinatronobacter alkalisoli TaxID=3028235 RepID=A0ABT5T8T2_9RHOB|nr:MalY/PatB family protein [Roseinatronobacter sp. HJB301]MDD7971531.1 pyridoxal phosphate-dependent aminotransferase [Roseinatronobacter sp. HJB301]